MFDRLKRNDGRQLGAWCAVVVVLCLSISGSVRADLVQYWTFDTDGANSVAGGNPAVFEGASGDEIVTTVPGALTHSTGAAEIGAGTGAYEWINLGDWGIDCGDADPAETPGVSHGVTYSFWFNANAISTDMRLFGPNTDSAEPRLLYSSFLNFSQADASLSLHANGWRTLAASDAIATGEWHHVAVTYIGSCAVAYLDGEYANSAAFSTALFTGGNYGVGSKFRNSYGTPFDGKIDDVAVWNTALSPDSIAQLAAGAAPTDIVERIELPSYSQVVNIDIDAFRWYARTDPETGDPLDPEQVFYPAYEGTGAIEGIGTTWNAVMPSMVSSDGQLGGDSEIELIGAVDSEGNATGINVYASGFEFGWAHPEGYNANPLLGDRFVAYPNNTSEWQIDGLTVGETYDLLFYGLGGNTVNVTSGAELQAVHWGVSTSDGRNLLHGEVPEDWVEGLHFVRVTVTPDSSTLTGTIRADDAGGMGLSGLQIALQGGGVEPLDGDLNGDGLVGSADLDIVRANWGASVDAGCLLCGDPSGDGAVGSADLDIVRANWGATAAAAVPEPGTCFLLLIGGSLVMFRKRLNRTVPAAVLVAFIAVAPAVATAEIVQYWKLDELDGSYWASNAIPTGNGGSLNSFFGDEWSTDVPAALSHSTGSLEFKKDYMQNLTVGDLNLSNVPETGNAPGVTMSMWIKPTTLADDTRLFGTPNGVTNAYSAVLRLNENGSIYAWAPATWYSVAPAGTVETGKWQNLTATFSDGGLIVYVDGKPVGSCAPAVFDYVGGEAAFSSPYINTYGAFYDGLLDDAVIWNETLSPSAVKQIAAGTAPESVETTFTLPTYQQIVNIDFKFGDLDAYAGKGVVEQAGTTWNEPVISGARYAAGCAATDMVDSDGAATTIDITCTGFEFGYEPGIGVDVENQPFAGDRLVAKTTADNRFEIGGLEVGATYDLFFYGHNQGTVDITAGATAQSGEFALEDYKGVFSVMEDVPEDWVMREDINFIKMTVTPTAATLTGEFNPSEQASPRMSWCGIQIAKRAPVAVPEPTTCGLLLGLATLLFVRRK